MSTSSSPLDSNHGVAEYSDLDNLLERGPTNNGEPAESSLTVDAETSAEPGTDSSIDEALQEWSIRLQRWQTLASLLAHALSLLMALLVLWWVHLLGGLSWSPGKTFNWHPFMMILAFCFMTVAALAFRYPFCYGSRSTVKFVHGSSWAVAGIFGMVALVAVFKSHNDTGKDGVFIANLYSFHSWFGLGVVGLYVVQFMAGFFAFGWNAPGFTAVTKAKILAIHSYMGPALHMAVAATIMLGIQEKEGFVNCSYKVQAADLWPLSHLSLIPTPCLVSHGLGITVFATALCTSFALHRFGRN